MKMNIVALLSVLVVSSSMVQAVGPAGCSPVNTDGSRKVLQVGTDTAGSLGYTPFEQGTGQALSGFDIEVIKEVAARIGFNGVNFVQKSFTDVGSVRFPLLTELNQPNSTLDVAVAALSIAERFLPNNTANPALTNIGYAKYADDTFGIILPAGVDAKFSDASTVLGLINAVGGITAFTIANSREGQTFENLALVNPDPYSGITAGAETTLTSAVASFKLVASVAPTKPNFLIVDNDTARKLFADTTQFESGKFRLITNVIDQANVIPSQGLGIAVGGINQSSTSCTQLLVNISAALKSMQADGTLDAFAKQFNVTPAAVAATVGTISPATAANVTPNIAFNVVYNFLRLKYGNNRIVVQASNN